MSDFSSVAIVNAKLELLVCLRGVSGPYYGRISTQGGAVDKGETPEDGAAREAREESGAHIDPGKLKLVKKSFKNGKTYWNYVAMVDKSFRASGPDSKHAWECIDTSHILGIPTHGRRVAWVPFDSIVAAGERGHFTQTIKDAVAYVRGNYPHFLAHPVSTSCRALGCISCKPGQTHYCKVCRKSDVDHRSKNCKRRQSTQPVVSTRPVVSKQPTVLTQPVVFVQPVGTSCRAFGCTSCKPGQAHYCKVCRTSDVDHRSENCPSGQSMQPSHVFFTTRPSIGGQVHPYPLFRLPVGGYSVWSSPVGSYPPSFGLPTSGHSVGSSSAGSHSSSRRSHVGGY